MPSTAFHHHFPAPRVDYLVMDVPDSDPALAYEIQARYAPGEAWVTLDVSVCRRPAVDEASVRRDPWGRVPTEVRVRRITPRTRPRR